MSGLPKRGDRLVVHWPNGPDFHMEFREFASNYRPPGRPDWHFLYGIVGYYPASDWFPPTPKWQILYAHQVGPGEWEMLPKLL